MLRRITVSSLELAVSVFVHAFKYCADVHNTTIITPCLQMVKDTVDAMNRPTGGAAPIANAKPQAQGVAVKPGQACHDEK